MNNPRFTENLKSTVTGNIAEVRPGNMKTRMTLSPRFMTTTTTTRLRAGLRWCAGEGY